MKKRSKSNWKPWAVGTILAVVVLLCVLQFLGVTHFFNSKPTTVYSPTVPTAGQSTKGQTGAPTLTHGESTGSSSTTTNVTLAAPSGDFVNNHNPSLSSQTLSQMFSVCNTTPGASCEITFTNLSTNVTKTLTKQTAKGSGTAYWSWTLQQLGMTQGTWKTVATATYGDQVKSTTDAMNLEVGQ
jgi:hypothetical protein